MWRGPRAWRVVGRDHASVDMVAEDGDGGDAADGVAGGEKRRRERR